MDEKVLTKEDIVKIFNESDTRLMTAFGTTTIMATKLPNGFVIVESFSVPDEESYDLDEGVQECTRMVLGQIWNCELYHAMYGVTEGPVTEKKTEDADE